MDTFALLRISEKLNIPVFDYRTHNKKAFCVDDSVVIDFSRIENERESKQLLSEEFGHILKKALYPLCYCGDRLRKLNIQKQERKALDCALRLQVPLWELKTAISIYSEDYEIAEALDVDLDVLSEAVEYFKRKGLI